MDHQQRGYDLIFGTTQQKIAAKLDQLAEDVTTILAVNIEDPDKVNYKLAYALCDIGTEIIKAKKINSPSPIER